MEITKFNVQNGEHTLPEVSYLKAGLMSPEDKENIETIKDMAGKAISEVNVSAEISPELSEEIERLNSAISDQSERLTRLHSMTESQGYCGRVWDESNADPKAMTWCGNLDMLRNLPELLGLGCYLVQNDHTRRKLDTIDHYKFADDGTEARLDGSDGHYQWGWNRVFYITTWHENNLFYEVISFEPIKGRESYRVPIGSMSASGRATIDRETNTLVSYINYDVKYRGGRNQSIYDNDPIKTLLGRPVSNMTMNIFLSAAHKNGIGWYAGSMRMYCVLKVLFDVIMGTRNCQADYNPNKDSDGLYQGGIGTGVINFFDNDWPTWVKYNNGNPFISMDICVEYGDFTGMSYEMSIEWQSSLNENKITKYTIPMFFGLKNPYGHIWTVSEDEYAYVILDENETKGICIHYTYKKIFDNDYVNDIENIMKLSESSYGDHYIKNLSYKNLECYPLNGNGSTSTYHCDYFWNYNYGRNAKRVFYRGCYATDNLSSGISACGIGHDFTQSSGGVGVALVEFTEEFPIEPVIS